MRESGIEAKMKKRFIANPGRHEFYFRALLDSHGIQRSMSRQGNCYDNAYAESFFHSLKTEMVYFNSFKSAAEAVAHIMDYISFYNTKRRHSSLGYQSPVDYERLAA